MTDERIVADLVLLHPPSVYDFRNRRDVLFAYLSNSDSVAASPIYEIYPLGFKSIENYLRSRGYSVRIVNLAALMLRKHDLDVPAFLAGIEARLFGIDLHWICHAHGGLAIAELLKRLHPGTPVVFGGISSTLYAEELIAYDQVDLVMEGYDTHEPLARLLACLVEGRPLAEVPNLLYKTGADRSLERTPFEYVPRSFGADCVADWQPFLDRRKDTSPALMVLPSAGCAYNCGWCGGSRDAVRRILRTRHTVVTKPVEAIRGEMESMAGSVASRKANIYTLNAYNFSQEALDVYLEGVKKAGIASVSYEQFHLTRPDVLERMVAAAKTTIHLSPESHDPEISRLAGRGVYTMDEMEEWIERALAIGVYSVNVWFFIGMPRQTAASVLETVDYCRHLLTRFRRRRVVPLLCPMVPFLDPGCTFFEHPAEHGYRIFFRTLEDHRRALVQPSWIRRLNYETEWMTRERLVEISYDAVGRLTSAKKDLQALPIPVADDVLRRIEEARDLVFRIDAVHETQGPEAVERLHGDEILAYNLRQFRGGVSDQLYPIPRSIENRWFDEFEID